MTATLGVFAKWPTPGRVKTRLAADTSLEFAARVADAFLHDTLARAEAIPDVRRVLAFDPPEAGERFGEFVGWHLVPQGSGDLGERMTRFFAGCRADGADCVVLTGTDSPTMPGEFVRSALVLLETADVVLGPATDGGYTLIGLSGPPLAEPEPIFAGMTWSEPGVLAATVERVRRAGWRLALLPPWYDVDTLADWRALCGHVRAMQLAGVVCEWRWTEALCAELSESSEFMHARRASDGAGI